MTHLKDFSDNSPQHDITSGGKGRSLALMAQNGLPVPDGFVILSTAFDEFLKDNSLVQEINTILESVDKNVMHTVEHASEKIVDIILKTEFPTNLQKEIISCYDKKEFDLVAVRSSATSEDGQNNAWAGQLESYLNTNKENLILNIRKCWASLFTPRAIFYRYQNNLNQEHISVAVVVQEMIQSDVSGIAFTVHPVTQNNDEAIIEAGLGLGEAIVSGKVTPDSYTVLKSTKDIIDSYLSEQTKKLILGGNFGNEWKDVINEEAMKQKLSNTEIKELTGVIIMIEKLYNSPQDIEWAYKNKKFYITQSRPITTLD